MNEATIASSGAPYGALQYFVEYSWSPTGPWSRNIGEAAGPHLSLQAATVARSERAKEMNNPDRCYRIVTDTGLVVTRQQAKALAAKPAILTTDKQARKEMPIARGVVDYFPLALAEVAHVSYVANEQHNPGQPMHWARGKSTDHADCIARHLIERGAKDDDGLRHSAKLAWRALALLQEELEAERASK
jgi:hypothetical protein